LTNAEKITGYNEAMLDQVELGDEVESNYRMLNMSCVNLAKTLSSTTQAFGCENLHKNYVNMKGVAEQNGVLNEAAGVNVMVSDSRKELCDRAVELAKTLAD